MKVANKVAKIATVCMKASLLLVACSSWFQAQTNKDAKAFEKLESEIRKDSDKLVAQVSPIVVEPKPSATPLAVNLNYDRFKDITTVSVGSREADRQTAIIVKVGDSYTVVNLYAAYSFPGQNPTKPHSIDVIFAISLNSALWLEPNPSFIVIADTKRHVLGNLSRSALPNGRVLYSIPISYETLAEISESDRVEVQIGSIDFRLNDYELQKLRLISGRPPRPAKERAIEPGRLENTSWIGKHISFDFKDDGTLHVQGLLLGNRNGIWSQAEDRLQVELQAIGSGWGSRVLAVGIIKGDKLALRYMVRDVLGFGIAKNVVLQQR